MQHALLGARRCGDEAAGTSAPQAAAARSQEPDHAPQGPVPSLSRPRVLRVRPGKKP